MHIGPKALSFHHGSAELKLSPASELKDLRRHRNLALEPVKAAQGHER
jgi:hypothetical protein